MPQVGAAARLYHCIPKTYPTQALFWPLAQIELLKPSSWLEVVRQDDMTDSELVYITEFCQKVGWPTPCSEKQAAALTCGLVCSPVLSSPPFCSCPRLGGALLVSAGCKTVW